MSCYWALKVIPLRYTFSFAKKISSLGYIIANKHRRIALENLEIAFGKEKSQEELVEIAKKCFEGMAKAGVELLVLLEKPDWLKKQVKIVGRENLDRALAKGNGVILVSAHFGNFPLMLARLSVENYKIITHERV